MVSRSRSRSRSNKINTTVLGHHLLQSIHLRMSKLTQPAEASRGDVQVKAVICGLLKASMSAMIAE